MIYNNLKKKNKFTKYNINKYKNLEAKRTKLRSTITFLIRCRNFGIIPQLIKNSIKNVHKLIEGNKETKELVYNKLTTHIENFQQKILNIIIEHKHNLLKENAKKCELTNNNLEKKILTEDELCTLRRAENTALETLKHKQKQIHIQKFEKLMEKQRRELNIQINDNWFVNKTNKNIPDNIKWLLSLGPKFALPTTKDNFPLFKYITDGEEIIHTNEDREKQEDARTNFTTMVENHINKLKKTSKDAFIIRTVAQTKTFMKSNKDIIILNSDKGNVTVAMDNNEYKERMMNLVGDIMTYQRMNKDPTTTLQKKNNELVEELFKNGYITAIERKSLKTDVANAPRIYGLPKIHKEGYPLRPICSSIDSPSREMCKYIVNILEYLTENSKYNIKDSVQFRNKLKNLTIKHDEKLVSFDVVSLFPSIPVDLAIDIIESRWEELKEYTNIHKNLFVRILSFCIKDNRYFKYENKIYKQKRGLPMGSPASPVIADIVMEKLLDTCINKLTTKPAFLSKYVDDLFVVIKESAIDETLQSFNSYHKNIKFTIEMENDNKLPYLDTMVIRNNKELKMNWYMKPTASGRIINFLSKHPKRIIINTAKNLIYRVLTISDEEFHQENILKIKNILHKNSFPRNLINNLIKEYTQRAPNEQNIEEKTKKIYKSIVYVPNISERVANSNIYDNN
ncbi:uncharacterized protein, partial [Musca autumnalis]|uniref:uncharacterized protein n=1 Tax=Musca autumnalis TaxID=221902 RepID=UPI003CF2FD22